MESKKTGFEDLKQIFKCIQIVYLVAVFAWLTDILLSVDTISYTPHLFSNGAIWVASLLFLVSDYVLIGLSEDRINAGFWAAARGCLIGLMLYSGETVGLFLAGIILFAVLGSRKKGEWKLYRSDISLLSALVTLVVLGILLLVNCSGTWWFQETVISSWYLDVLLVVAIILCGRKKIWSKLDKSAFIRPVCIEISIVTAIALVIATVFSLMGEAEAADNVSQFIYAVRNASVTAFSEYPLIPAFEIERGITHSNVLFCYVVTFAFCVWEFNIAFKGLKRRVLHTALSTVLAVYCGLWTYPLFYLIAAVFLTFVKYRTADAKEVGDRIAKLPLKAIGIVFVILSAFPLYTAERIVKADEEYALEQERIEYLKIKPQVVDIDNDYILNARDSSLISSVDHFFIGQEFTDITGWVIVNEEVSEEEEICLCLMNNETGTVYQIYTDREERLDVAARFRNLDYAYCGYVSKLATGELDDGEYEVLYYIRTNGENGRLVDSGETLDIMSYEERQKVLQEEYEATKPELIELGADLPAAEDANINYTIESIEEDDDFIKIKGWVFAEGYTMPENGFSIALKSVDGNDAYVLPVTPLDRTDVTASFNSDGANYDHCGFIALINKSAVPVGSYYLCFNTESDIGYDWTGTSYPIILEQPDDE